MKKILLASLLFIGCQKQFDKPSTRPDLHELGAAQNTSIFIGKEDIVYPVDEVDFDNCTNDSIHFTGLLRSTFNYQINDNILNSAYEIHFEDIHGVGLNGTKYVGVGHFTDQERGYLPGDGTIFIFNQNVTDKTMFTSPGGQTLTSNFDLHIVGDLDSVKIERVKFNIYCQ